MAIIPKVLPELEAGEVPGQIAAACKLCQVQPDELMSWSLKPDAATIILPDGRKVVFPVVGKWINLPLPWLMEESCQLTVVSSQFEEPAAKHMSPVGSFDLPAGTLLRELKPGPGKEEPDPAKPRRKK